MELTDMIFMMKMEFPNGSIVDKTKKNYIIISSWVKEV